jgi:VanZ family protein
VWPYAPPLLWTLVISAFSTSVFSAAQTSRVMTPILHWLLPGLEPPTMALVHTGIRAAMHPIVFGILVLLWYRALRGRPARSRLTAVTTALLLTVAVAGADELHQTFVSSRTGQMRDVGWDSLGATLALAARRLVWRG